MSQYSVLNAIESIQHTRHVYEISHPNLIRRFTRQQQGDRCDINFLIHFCNVFDCSHLDAVVICLSSRDKMYLPLHQSQSAHKSHQYAPQNCVYHFRSERNSLMSCIECCIECGIVCNLNANAATALKQNGKCLLRKCNAKTLSVHIVVICKCFENVFIE